MFLTHAIFTLAFGLGVFPTSIADLLSIFILVVFYAVVAVTCLRAANRTQGRTKWGWALYAAGATGIVLGVTILLAFVFATGTAFDVAGFNFFLFIMANALGVAALSLLLPPRVTQGSQARLVLDALVVAGCAFLLTWLAGAGALYAKAEGPWTQRVTDLSYPFLNALLLTLVVVTFAKAREEITPSLAFLFIGVAIVSLTDPFYTWFSLNGYHVPATMVGTLGATGVVLCQILAATRATTPAPTTAPRASVPNLVAQAFPLVPAAVALPAVAIVYAVSGTVEPVVFWATVLVVTVLFARLALTLADNRRLAIQLAATADLKSQMLGFISHEMANPLTPLRVQLYTMGQRDSAPDRSLEIANRSVTRLTTLARDARSLTQLDAGQLKLDRQEHDLGKIVIAAVESAEAAAIQRNLSLQLEGSVGPLPVSVDLERVGQVLDNLLSNALKFTPAGGHVAVNLRSDAYSGIISITDSGLGMSPKQLEQLFKPFSRVHGNVAPGTGLGLYISHGIIQAHGGEIWAESKGAGLGTTFHVRINLSRTVVGKGVHPRTRPPNVRSV